MKKFLQNGRGRLLQQAISVFLFFSLLSFHAPLNEVLIDFKFQSATLPAGVITSGTISTSGSINNCTECSPGRLVLSTSGYLQVNVPNSFVFIVKMKSSGATARQVTVKYKFEGEEDYEEAGVLSVVQAGPGVYNLTDEFPVLVTANPVSVRLENAPSGGEVHIHDLYVEGSTAPSTSAEITAFKLINQIGNEVISSANATIGINVPLGTSLNEVVPATVTISIGASIAPAANVARDFSGGNEVDYIVTAQDGETTKEWKVKVTEVASSEKEIISFKLSNAQLGNAVISSANATVAVNMPFGEDLSSLVPVTFTVSAHASVNPLVGSVRDFSQEVIYTLTAQDNSTKQWTIIVNEVDPDTNVNIDFEVPVGFASVVTGSGTYNYTSETFYGPVTGGQHAEDTLWINGPDEFDILAKAIYNRRRVYNNASQLWGGTMNKSPLVIVLKEGVYIAGTTESSSWNNSQKMMRLQEQGDLTIIGQNNVVLNWGFNVNDSWNILIRNITFQDYYDDGVNVDGGHHIWIDHCTFGHPTTRPANTEHPDGGVDIKSGASYVTVSWSRFRNSWKTNLIGHSDNNGAEDRGNLKVTLYANHYQNSNSRNPRVRFGEIHFLNNFNEDISLYGIAASIEAQVYAENNFYLNTRWPMYADRNLTDFRAVYGNNSDNVFTSKTGNKDCTGLKAVGNEYDDSGLPLITNQINPIMVNPSGRSIKFDEKNPELVFNPYTYYAYEAFPASTVRVIVPLYAGAEKVNFFQTSPQVLVASISINGTLNPFNQDIGSASETQTYKVSASNLSAQLSITPPDGFEVSINDTDWFSKNNPLIISPESGNINSENIHVRLHATEAGSYSGIISHASSGATAALLNVTGTVIVPGVPQITVGGSLTAFTQNIGSASAVKSYIISGSNLAASVSITPPNSFEVSLSTEGPWSKTTDPLVLNEEDGTISETTIYVRLNAKDAGSYSGDIVHSSEAAQQVNISVQGEASVQYVAPKITVVASLAEFTQVVGSASDLQSYFVEAIGLTENLRIITPTNFELSTDDGITWKTNGETISLTPVNGKIDETTVLVRMNVNKAGNFFGSVLHISGQAAMVDINVSGVASVVTGLPDLEDIVIKVFPNPTQDHVTIYRGDHSNEALIVIYSTTGLKLLTMPWAANNKEISLSMSSLASGVYFIEYLTKSEKKLIRLIKF